MIIKVVKPRTPGQRNKVVIKYDKLTTKTPCKQLLISKKRSGGRNNQGKLTARHIGGGAKKFYRIIDFKRTDKKEIPGLVKTIEYDPCRNVFISLVVYADGEKRYVLNSEGMKVGDSIVCNDKTKLKNGNRLKLKYVPSNFTVYNIELKPQKGGSIARSAGMGCKVMGMDGKYCIITLPSGEVRKVLGECFATLGKLSNEEFKNIRLGKAGATRHRGKKPKVLGKSKNPVDHPHGGGEGHSPIGLKNPKTPQGKPALGPKTRKLNKYSNKYIIRKRKK